MPTSHADAVVLRFLLREGGLRLDADTVALNLGMDAEVVERALSRLWHVGVVREQDGLYVATDRARSWLNGDRELERTDGGRLTRPNVTNGDFAQ